MANKVLLCSEPCPANDSRALEAKGYELYHMKDAEDPSTAGIDPAEVEVMVNKGSGKASANCIKALPNLKVISVFGVGYDGIDVDAASAQGVKVTHTPGVLTDEVANLAVGMLSGGDPPHSRNRRLQPRRSLGSRAAEAR